MDKLKEVAQALGLKAEDEHFKMEGESFYFDIASSSLILVYGKGGILEKKGWWWKYAIEADAWKLLNSNGEELLDFHPIDRDPQVVIDAFLKTLPREPELPELLDTSPGAVMSLDPIDIARELHRAIEHIKSLTVNVAKLREGK